ncbi:MAG: macro domain-containing protein [Selenomonadaceae bacterium]|nr:macro domain-containing protein [Selenomonadaceae bacterium]
MALKFSQEDITQLKVDAIVNAANTQLLAGGGVCGAIFRAAGHQQLQAACNKLSPIQTGEAVITNGFNLPAKFIIHTAGPIWNGGTGGEENLLRACYSNSLKLAVEKNCRSVAFPLISSGIYGYPPNDALAVAVDEIKNFLKQHDLEVTLTLMKKALLDRAISLV